MGCNAAALQRALWGEYTYQPKTKRIVRIKRSQQASRAVADRGSFCSTFPGSCGHPRELPASFCIPGPPARYNGTARPHAPTINCVKRAALSRPHTLVQGVAKPLFVQLALEPLWKVGGEGRPSRGGVAPSKRQAEGFAAGRL